MTNSILRIWTLGVVISLCCSLAVTMGQLCGNGVVEMTQEECDDANEADDDGCSSNCTVESHYHCTINSNSTSECDLVLLDLNSSDHTTLDRSLEFFDLDTPVFLVDPTTLEFINQISNWTYLDIVLLQADEETIQEMVGLDFGNSTVHPTPYGRELLGSDYQDGLNGRRFVDGQRVAINAPLGDSELQENQLRPVLLAVMYEAENAPSFDNPRYVCLVANGSELETTACVKLHYIGHNDNAPTVSYETVEVAVYVEDQSQPLPFVTGNITVTDADHPTRYLMESASARIVGFTPGSPEWLSFYGELPNNLSSSFNDTTGTLTISGNDAPLVYSHALKQLTYFNNMTQPDAARDIEVTVFDGIRYSDDPVIIEIDIMNTNDIPSISLDGESPIVTSLTSNYTEGSGAVPIASNIYVIDVDPNANITRAEVVLIGAVDGDQEVLNVTDPRGLTLTLSHPSHSLELIGAASPDQYTAAIRSLTYHHLSANPGNPTSGPRVVQFTVVDNNNSSSTSYLMLEIVPVNDPPRLSFLSGAIEEEYSYIEDDLPINIGQGLNLTDIDSPIQSVSLSLTDLLDGDSVYYNTGLVVDSSITVNTTTNGTSRDIIFSGESSSSTYNEILKSLTYTNLYTNNSVANGTRTLSISATDAGGRVSPNILTILVHVANRNDGPVVDLGLGFNQVNYTEGESDVGIGVSYQISISDEEGDRVSSIDIELVATNGNLDPQDILFLLTRMDLDPDSLVITATRITASSLESDSDYVDVLRGLRYTNSEDEPTLFVNGVRVHREIVIRITDEALATNVIRVPVEIEPINDNAPRIIINSDPVCTQDYRDSETTVMRRSVDPGPSIRRRRRRNTHLRNTDTLAAPQVLGISPVFTESSSGVCLTQMVVKFNTDTNVPVVEIEHKLDSLLTFSPASLASTPHRGYWRDYKTLVIVFRECVQWEREEEQRKPLYVVFYGSEGSCTWDSPCDKGVCYYNSTGCPVVGYHRVSTSSTNEGSSPEPDSVQDYSPQYYGPDRVSVLMLCLVLLVAVITVASCQCWRLVKGRPGGEESLQMKTKHSVPTYVIEIQDPIGNNSTPVQLNTEEGDPQKSGLPKDGHCLPPYVESCAATFTSSAVSVTDKPVMAGGIDPSGMKKTGDSDVMDDECGGAEDTNELIRHGGKFPPPIDTGGTGRGGVTGSDKERHSSEENSAPPREQSRNTHSVSNSSTQIPH